MLFRSGISSPGSPAVGPPAFGPCTGQCCGHPEHAHCSGAWDREETQDIHHTTGQHRTERERDEGGGRARERERDRGREREMRGRDRGFAVYFSSILATSKDGLFTDTNRNDHTTTSTILSSWTI